MREMKIIQRSNDQTDLTGLNLKSRKDKKC